MIKSAFRHEIKDRDLDIKVPRLGLTATVPDWATIDILKPVAARMDEYDQSIQKRLKEESEQKQEEPNKEPTQETIEFEPEPEGENPFDRLMAGKEIDDIKF